MRSRVWIAALLAVALNGAPVALAQQREPAPSAPSENVFEAIGGAIRGIFQSIFGERSRQEETPNPQQQQQQQQSPPPAPAVRPDQDAAAKEPAPAQPAAPDQPVTATPSAQAAPQSLQSAIAKGDYPGAMKMIEQGTDIEAKDPGAGASALHYAVMKGSQSMIGFLVQRGADVNSRTKSGTTPLHTAVLYNHYEVAEYLIGKGADVNAKSTSGVTPLALALAAKYKHIEKLLRERGGN